MKRSRSARAPLALFFAAGMALPALLRAGEETMDLIVDIPAVIAVEVRGEVTFDLSRLPGPSSPNDCRNVYPPGSACKVATYDPTEGQTITLNVFDNSESGSTVLSEKISAGWSHPFGEEVATTDLQVLAAADVTGKSTGAVTTSPSAIARVPARGRWVTLTRSFRLVAPVSSLLETPKEGIRATVTYTVAHADERS